MRFVLDSYRAAFSGLPRQVWLLSAVLLVNRVGTMVLPFLALYVTQHLGASLEVAGLVLAAWGVGHLAGAFAGGWLCDVVGPLRIQFLALFGSGLGFLAMEHVRDPWILAAVVALTGTFAESFRPANSSALAAFTPDALQPRAVALNRLAVNLGFSLAPAIGGPLAAFDYAWLFRVDGATSLAASLLLLWLFRDVLARGRLHTEADATRTVHWRDEIHPARDPLFLAFLAAFVFFGMMIFQAWSSYPVYLKEVYGVAETGFGFLMSANAVNILLFEMLLTRWAERFRPLYVVAGGILLFGLGFAALPAGRGFLFALALVSVWTAGEMLAIPFAGGWVALRAGRRHRGKSMGLYTAAWGIAFIAGPALGTRVYTHAGATALWLGVGCVAVVVAAAMLLLAAWESRQEGRGAQPSTAEAARWQ